MDVFKKCRDFTAAREVMAMGYYPYFQPISSEQDTEVYINGQKILMLGSNSYLGLTNHPYVKKKAIEAIERYGTGCAGSRFLNGTLELHVKLEERLAKFVKKEAALLFSTGFQSNLGAIAPLVGRKDVVILDKLDHASIIDAARLSFGEIKKFNHNDVAHLEKILKDIDSNRGKLIVVDGVYSMSGDIAPLPDIIEVARKYNARVMVDDAHGIGVLGENGAGTASHFGLDDEVDIIMGTFSKSFASLGGFIAAEEDVIHYLKHNSRALIFSASITPASAAAVDASLDIMINEPERREKLWQNTEKMRKGLQEMGYNTWVSESPIIPIIIGDDLKTFQMWKELFYTEHIFTNPVVSPAVPPGMALIRTSYMATHTEEQLDRALESFERVGKKFGVI